MFVSTGIHKLLAQFKVRSKSEPYNNIWRILVCITISVPIARRKGNLKQKTDSLNVADTATISRSERDDGRERASFVTHQNIAEQNCARNLEYHAQVTRNENEAEAEVSSMLWRHNDSCRSKFPTTLFEQMKWHCKKFVGFYVSHKKLFKTNGILIDEIE